MDEQKRGVESVEIHELSDGDLEGAAGGDSYCCCSTTGGDCSNKPKPTEEDVI
jgi:hypothetical protein